MSGSEELRRLFHDEMADVQRRVAGMAAAVAQSAWQAAEALVTGDGEQAGQVVAADGVIDASYAVVEDEVFHLVARQAPVARDLRFLIATLRVAQEIERCGDLVASVGRRAARLDQADLTDPVRALLTRMGAEAAGMLRAAGACYAVLDAEGAGRVAGGDDVMDGLHRDFLHELFTSGGPAETLVELGLVGRFYERVADHAVVIAERVRYVVEGAMNPLDADEQGH